MAQPPLRRRKLIRIEDESELAGPAPDHRRLFRRGRAIVFATALGNRSLAKLDGQARLDDAVRGFLALNIFGHFRFRR